MNSKTNILVVDDEAGIRYFIRETLTDAGYDVFAVDSAEKALIKQKEQHFDLALIDLRMPGMDGIALLSALRQYSPDLEIIVLTGHASLETAVEALRQGAHDYLFKPCEPDQLRQSVSAAIHKRKLEQDTQQAIEQLESYINKGLQKAIQDALGETSTDSSDSSDLVHMIGPLVIDSTRHVATLLGETLPLSPTEFKLLEYLVAQSPRVISAEELALESLGYTGNAWEIGNLIRTHIYRLRKKTQAIAPDKDVISTVRGIGYQVDMDLIG